MTNEDIFNHHTKALHYTITTFSRANKDYNKLNILINNTTLVNGYYEDMKSQASLILWELILTNQVGMFEKFNLVQYKVNCKLNAWKANTLEQVKIPHRVLKGFYSYRVITEQLKFSKVFTDSSVTAVELLEELKHPLIPLLEKHVREQLEEHYVRIEKLSRKPYKAYIKHILKHCGNRMEEFVDADISVDPELFSASDMSKVYSLLNGVEESYFKLKRVGMSNSEIASIKDVSVSWVSRRLEIAREKITNHYNVEG